MKQVEKNGTNSSRDKWTDSSVFNAYPNRTLLQTSGIDEQVEFLSKHVPGLSREQAQIILESSYGRKTSAVFGGSRIRGDHSPTSDIDVGFGDLNANQASKLLKKIREKSNGKDGYLNMENTRITPGNETVNIEKITSPEEFFQRQGTRKHPDEKAGEDYYPSGSITLKLDGTIEIIPPGQL